MSLTALRRILTVAALLGVSHRAGAQIDTTTPRVRPEADRLAAMTLSYIATVRHGIDTREIGERIVQLKNATYAGSPAWEIVETRGAGANASVDTLITDLFALTPYHWGATQQMPTGLTTSAGARVSIEFRADSMVGIITAPTGRRTVLGPMPGSAFLTAAHTEVALRALPLSANWRDSVSVVVTDLGKTTVIPGEFLVNGEERVQTTAGTFDCWLVALTTEVGQTQYWVAKSDRIVVKTLQVLPESGDLLQYLLTRISR